MADFDKYYETQAGTGISGFSGVRYQKGNGFFGRFISGAVLPILKYFGKKVLHTGANVATDMLDGGDFKKVLKKNLGTSARSIAADAMEKMKAMTGGGKRIKKQTGPTPKRRRVLSKDPRNVARRAARARKNLEKSIKGPPGIRVAKPIKGIATKRKGSTSLLDFL
jgi:hypothetical protein